MNAECFPNNHKADCRCRKGYYGNPLDRCRVIGCYSNGDCPGDYSCINMQCINPCVHSNPCSSRAECRVFNHLPICRCPAYHTGNPYIACKPEERPECTEDSDCPNLLACFDNKCQNPCTVVQPCSEPSECKVLPTYPVRTMVCVCPSGYVSSGSGTCRPTKPIVDVECTRDSDCPSEKSCINAVCKNPCACGPNAECSVANHKPICSCVLGYDGNPDLACTKVAGCRADGDCSGSHACVQHNCVPVCSPLLSTCGKGAVCNGINHKAICECPPGYGGNARVSCVLLGCKSNSDCPTNKACINDRCENPCAVNPCTGNMDCNVYNHIVECACPSGYIGDTKLGCTKLTEKCKADNECPSQTACFNGECINPCVKIEPCGINADCKVLDTSPVRTMICECIPGYRGNAVVRCDKTNVCPVEKGQILDEYGNCVCPPGSAKDETEVCIPCRKQSGMIINDEGYCVCALENGMIIDEYGRCVCPTQHGYRLDANGYCKLVDIIECKHDDDCADNRFCDKTSQTCEDPCLTQLCGLYALCNATRHQAICICINGYIGNAYTQCYDKNRWRTDFPRPEMVVSCLSDGVQVEIHLHDQEFDGVLYVKGHSKDEQCRRVVSIPAETMHKTEIFKVAFGNCGLIHVNGQASFVLVIQKHPKLMTYKTQAYHIKCIYQTGEQNVTLGFNVSMLTTAGTIANTGPPPVCLMKIVTQNGNEINSAEIGDNLMLQVEVQPSTIYGGFARNCVAKTMEDNLENEYIVTDENGCATDPTIFGEWEQNPETQTLMASFNAFKFPSSDNIRFQCNIRVCFGRCQPVSVLTF